MSQTDGSTGCAGSPDGGDVLVTFAVSNRQELPCLLEELTARECDVRIQRVVNSNAEPPEVLQIDAQKITDKQWEAMEIAVQDGYYRRPRETDIEQIGAILGISKSGASQRLRSGEANLVTAAIEDRYGVDS